MNSIDENPAYAELHAISNFSFLRGASYPEELVEQAARLGYTALALTDECSVAGVVRAHMAARDRGLQLIIGTEIALNDGGRVVLLATSRAAYGELCGLVTRGRRAAGKGHYQLQWADLSQGLPGCLALLLPQGGEQDERHAQRLMEAFPACCWLAVELLRGPDDAGQLQRLQDLSRRTGMPAVACGDVHMHRHRRRVLQDVLTAIRLGQPLSQLGRQLHPNGERHLRDRRVLARLYPAELLEESVRIARRCDFSLDCLRYEYPRELSPAGLPAGEYLASLVREGLERRWPDGSPQRVRELVEHELALILELRYEAYFLTVYDIVRYARQEGILCQGRGSAANSAVCYCLQITEVDPARMEMLFERFISRERNEPPDIDVDFEHDRREEVIQYIYAKYGRHRAALAAAVITYRPRSAIRDVGKALGLAAEQVERLARSRYWWDGGQVDAERLAELGFAADSPVLVRLVDLLKQLVGFPRHLSQHVGGFVIARDSLARLVPVENAAMAERTVIQWDKNDLDALGLLKVDVLALGMLSAIRRCLQLMNDWRYPAPAMAMGDIPAEDPHVYAMLQRAETIGVFQVESRAQMAMLPRLRPETFYDLVIEVAIVRPGPIQGGMVHPYLRRRQGQEQVSYPSPAVRGVLQRTLGVPIFQEQVMKLAVVAAGFTPGEADQLRRSMAAWRRRGGLAGFEDRLINGMLERGYKREFAQQVFQQIQGFGEYGFPESHAASFALLVYVSAWLKHYAPAAFCAALLNSQPMGFYAPAQLVGEARRQGVVVREVDINTSVWDCVLERITAQKQVSDPADDRPQPALRLGLRMVKGLSRGAMEQVLRARAQGPFKDVMDLARRGSLSGRDLNCLSAAGALACIAGDRHQARWQVLGVETLPPLLGNSGFQEARPALDAPTEVEDLLADYASQGLSLGRHPLALLRPQLERKHCVTARRLKQRAHGSFARTVGLVINRQRPLTASGVTFVTLEDETGHINLVVWNAVAEKQRQVLLHAQLLGVSGHIEREGSVVHLVAGRLADYSSLMAGLSSQSRDFH